MYTVPSGRICFPQGIARMKRKAPAVNIAKPEGLKRDASRRRWVKGAWPAAVRLLDEEDKVVATE